MSYIPPELMRLVSSCLLYFLTYLACLAAPKTGSPGIVFVENKGQWPTEVHFRADLPGGFLFLTNTGLHYAFYDTRDVGRRHASGPPAAPLLPTVGAHGVGVSWLGVSAQHAHPEGINPVGTSFGYMGGSDSRQWSGGVRGYTEVVYRDIYPGISLRLYAYFQTLKYEFLVQPGADPAQIRLAYAGADQLTLADNRLTVKTSVNEFRENAPYSFTTRAEKATEVPAQWALDGQTASFIFPKGYDTTQLLTVDPELVFTTFSGSVANNFGHTATYDAEGNTYIAGSAWGAGFPTTVGAFRVSFAGLTDLGIMKFSSDGARLLYSVTIGGNEADIPHSAVVNSRGELVVMGSTASPDFPTTATAFQRRSTARAGQVDVVYSGSLVFRRAADFFILCLDKNGSSLVGSTLLGGTETDGLNMTLPPPNSVHNYADEFRSEVIVGPDDAVYLTGTAQSADFPVTDGSVKAGFSDAVVCKLSPNLSRLIWSTRLAGNNTDEGYGLRLSADGTLYVCGTTYSTNLGTAGSLKPALAGVNDGFLARLNVAGKVMALTYLGTTFSDVADLVDVGPGNIPHVLGQTKGLYPVTPGTYSNPNSGQFIHALTPDLSRTVFATVIGTGRSPQRNGSVTGPDIAPTAFLVNDCGNIYLAGWGGAVNQRNNYNDFSTTTGLPVTPDAHQLITNGSNFWIGLLSPGAKALLYGTFMGDNRGPVGSVSDGDHVDGGTCRFDKDGTIYHAACSCRSNRFPATASAWSKTRESDNCNNVAFKFDIDKLKAAFDTYAGPKKNVVEGCAPLTLTFQNTSLGGRRYDWQIDGRVRSTEAQATTFTFDKPGEYMVRLRAYNPLNCKLIDSTQQLIKVYPSSFSISPDTTLCADRPVLLSAQGGQTYLWAPAAGLANPTSASLVVRPQATTTYTVSMTNAAGCVVSRSVSVRIDNSFQPEIGVTATPDCGKPTQLLFTNTTVGADQFVWVMRPGDTLRTRTPDTYRFPRSGTYEIVVTASKQGCLLTRKLPVIYEDFSQLPNVVTANNDGKNDVFDVGFTGARLEIYNRWGRLLFATDQYANDWGRKTPHGTYFYLLTTPAGSRCKGWIEVLE